MSAPDLSAYARAVAAETRAAQGLPPRVDATVLAAASALLGIAPVKLGGDDR